MTGYRQPPPETPPPSVTVALVTPLCGIAGFWIESRCTGCGNLKIYPIRMLLTERRERAHMPLRRAVAALAACERCGQDGCRLARVSNPRCQESQPVGGPPNWSQTIAGSDVGAVVFATTEV
jgi:hypothetical protein